MLYEVITIGVSKQAIWQFENQDNIQPKPENLFMLAQILDFPTSFFLEKNWQNVNVGKCFYRASSTTTKKLKDTQKELNIIRAKMYSFLST